MINLITITAVYIKYCNARLPDTIHINKSETVSLCYDVPVSATNRSSNDTIKSAHCIQTMSHGQI